MGERRSVVPLVAARSCGLRAQREDRARLGERGPGRKSLKKTIGRETESACASRSRSPSSARARERTVRRPFPSARGCQVTTGNALPFAPRLVTTKRGHARTGTARAVPVESPVVRVRSTTRARARKTRARVSFFSSELSPPAACRGADTTGDRPPSAARVAISVSSTEREEAERRNLSRSLPLARLLSVV